MKMHLIPIVCLAVGMTVPASADWLLVEGFENGSNSFEVSAGTETGALIPDPTKPGNTVFEYPGEQTTMRRDIFTEPGQLEDDSVGTLFYQVLLVEGRAVDAFLGFTDFSASSNWNQYICYAGVYQGPVAPEFRVRAGDENGGGGNTPVFTPVLEGGFYNVWMVVDLITNRYNVYLEGPGLEQTLVAENFMFRRTGDPGALDILQFKGGPGGADSLIFDNIFLDLTGENLTVPEFPAAADPFRITNFVYLPGDSAELFWESIPDHEYAIEKGENLVDWEQLTQTEIATDEAASAFLEGDDIISTSGSLYYRVRDLGIPQ